MSWAPASFAVLGAALAAGFAWYERSQPSSRVLAVVATLAALAALGRIAFAPLPNVKPTTDIVVLAGFALGGAPGFAVGATAALTSNVVFGQGPWTPWQMVAWGACGVFGAVLARLSGGRVARVPLALCCGLAAYGFGVVMDYATAVGYGGQGAGGFLAIHLSSLPFNLAHAVGSVLFCLLFGPTLVHMLARSTARLHVDWRPVAGPLLLVALLAGATLRPAPAQASSTSRALAYLGHAQNRDGGWGAARGQRSAALYASWAVLARSATDAPCGRAATGYVRRFARTAGGAGDLERSILTLRSCRLSAGALVGRLDRKRRGDGSVGGLQNLTSFAVLAWRAAGSSPGTAKVRRATAWVARQQNGDGGFSYARRGGASGVDDTAGAAQALAAGGQRGRLARAVRYLRRAQHADGGFGATAGAASNAQSTAWAIQGLIAAGVDPNRVRRGGSRTPQGYLRTLQAADGSVRYSRSSAQTPVWVTAQAAIALAGRAFPYARR